MFLWLWLLQKSEQLRGADDSLIIDPNQRAADQTGDDIAVNRTQPQEAARHEQNYRKLD